MTKLAFVKPITVWEFYCKQQNGKWSWEHNHIEFGHRPEILPNPVCEIHKKTWSGGTWRKYFHYLDENNVVI